MNSFSFSSISMFESCPKSFEFKYNKKIPEAFMTIERHLGSCIHEILNWAYQKRLENSEVDFLKAEEQYKSVWHSQDLEKIKIVKKEKKSEDYFIQGLDLIDSFLQRVFSLDSSSTMLLEHKFEINLDSSTKYVGIVDRIARQSDGVLRITDFKTGRVSHPLDNLQLPSYALFVFKENPDDKIELCFEDLSEQRTLITLFHRKQQEEIKQKLLKKIAQTREVSEFKTNPSVLCMWCGYQDICDNPHESVKQISVAANNTAVDNDPEKLCPQCGGALRERKGKFGLFLGCGNFPECRYTLDIKEVDHSEKSATTGEETCPECGGVLRKRTGKYGPFFGCGNYPECRFTRKINS